MKKKIIISLCVIFVLLAGGVVYLFTNMDSIVKSLIEKVGTETVGTKVSLDSVSISLFKGKATIKGLKVANPDGFSDAPMIQFGKVSAQIDYKTRVIRNINIEEPEFLVEQKGLNTNFGVVQEKMRAESCPKEQEKVVNADAGSTGKERVETAEEAKVYQLDSFTIKDAKIRVVSLDSGHKAVASAANITLENLKGTPEKICSQVFVQLAQQIIQKTANTSVKEIINKNVKGDLGKAINEHLKNINF